MPNNRRIAVVVPEIARHRDGGGDITMSHWLVKLGQQVDPGAAVVEVICDKTTFEVSSSDGGVLVETLRAFGDTVTIGEVIGWLDADVAPWFVPLPDRPDAVGRCRHCRTVLLQGDVACRHCGAPI